MRRINWVVVATLVVASAIHVGQAVEATSSRTFTVDNDVPYDPNGRRDPFRPPLVEPSVNNVGLERTPLQRYELGQLNLVAIIYDTGSPRAVVEDQAGLGYIVKVGTSIGVHGGVVRSIDRGRLMVEEESVDFFGERRSAEVVLEMASGERERGNR